MNNSKYIPDEPIAAIATALSPAALAIVRTSGSDCISLVSRVFSRPKALLDSKGNTIVYGWILDGGEKIDEVLISVFRKPKSFTGEEMAEISCHGGGTSAKRILETLLKNGFRLSQKGEFTFRAFLHGKTDLTRAEAIREIIDSKTEVSRSRAAFRLSGSLFDTIHAVRALLIETLADIEAEIEYPEDENAIADSFEPEKIDRAIKTLEGLESSWKTEKIYQDGVRVVLCGRANAGKSSLFNALLKEERAIVSEKAGTTRDFLESEVDFGGIPARLFDTAGLREKIDGSETIDEIEQRGIALSHSLMKKADVILYLVDSEAGATDEDVAFLRSFFEKNKTPQSVRDEIFVALEKNTDELSFIENQKNQSEIPLFLVLTKSDISKKETSRSEKSKNVFFVSSKTLDGIFELEEGVGAALISLKGGEGRVSLGSERQRLCVKDALERLYHAKSSPKEFGLDATVQDLEDALDSLSDVIGETTAEDVLESVFSRFCVGK